MYSLPLTEPSYVSLKRSQKRTRRRAQSIDEEGATQDELQQNTEYSAVITPDERLQRRLAGNKLNEAPPALPFPHAPLPGDGHEDVQSHNTVTSSSKPDSLRLQHLSSMMAVLHRCLQTKDYSRASRAFALILRTEVNGRTIDIRHGGLWGIGAEILLHSPNTASAESPSIEGFERAKSFYDKMALQYPWHRSWPNVTNAQDFKTAMFGLWIYVICQESKRLQAVHDSDTLNVRAQELQAKEWELAEAEKLAREMDSLLNTIPFIDDLELIRLRAMVALWMADLFEGLDDLEAEMSCSASVPDTAMEKAWLGHEADEEPSMSQTNAKALAARHVATSMFGKLGEEVERNTVSDEIAENVMDISY